MNRLYSVAEIRAIEHAAAAVLPDGALMQRAGQSGANAALDMLPFSTNHAKVLVLAGPGNNGGDALEAAAHLAYAGANVTVLHYAPIGEPSAERQTALQRARVSDVSFADVADTDSYGGSADSTGTAGGAEALVAGVDWNLVVDGLFGIGLKRPLDGAMRALVEAVNLLKCQVLALDVPSGLDADTGAIVGPDGVAVRATHTITFIGDKPGLHTCEGRDHAGLVDVARLEIDAALFPPASMHVNDVKLFSRHLRPRQHSSHKGSYGNVAVIGGALGMAGAPLLAARAALHGGAGRVYALFVDEPLPCDAGQPEVMCRGAGDFDLETATLVIGPGLGASSAAAALLGRAVACDGALLADADALNLIAATPSLREALAQRKHPAVLTPHPLEAARLLECSVGEVQADRVLAARKLAAALNAVVVLKGSGTVIAAPTGGVVVNTTGNPALATAGTGDVLAGLCGSLMAQGWPQWEAALGAVWLHGMAADVLVADGAGPIGLTAGELIPAIRVALNRMVQHHGR
ncbi:NAD(P)H-hydrate dehydratase [Oxalobacteraceae bacterium OTU3CAMAD1]|nr:NAD(P)H-hydrate dehydratase [Oxalobacteraceae bacterium OTU3CAMAD1]